MSCKEKPAPSLSPRNIIFLLVGAHEGAFAWLTLNYLLGRLGNDISSTVAAIDLGGGSVQEAFALPEDEAEKAPDGYITELKALGSTYYVYVHRYVACN